MYFKCAWCQLVSMPTMGTRRDSLVVPWFYFIGTSGRQLSSLDSWITCICWPKKKLKFKYRDNYSERYEFCWLVWCSFSGSRRKATCSNWATGAGEFINIEFFTLVPLGVFAHWFAFLDFLVSTYVVCERLSVMQRQARLPEIFDQIAQNTLFWNLVQNTPHPPPWKLKFSQILALWVLTFQNLPPRKLKFSQILALWVLTFQNTPPPSWKLKFRQILALWLLTVGVCGD